MVVSFQVTNFLKAEDSTFAKLKDELASLDYIEKNNDLYKFKQSVQDLRHYEGLAEFPAISSFHKFLVDEVKHWVGKAWGVDDLTDEVDAFAARYDYSDYLLAHDDQLEGRRIAYIWYLTDDKWGFKDGGKFTMIHCNPEHQPSTFSMGIAPQPNQLLTFEVSPRSYHMVAEVLSRDKSRVSIGGWFHSPTKSEPHVFEQPKSFSYDMDYIMPGPEKVRPGDIEEDVFYAWVNPQYLDVNNQAQIQQQFSTNSEISLSNFIKAEKYQALSDALLGKGVWINRGPLNRNFYEVLIDAYQVPVIKECVRFLRSDAMFLLLSNLTGLRLHELAPEQSDSEDAEDGAGAGPSTSASRNSPSKRSPGKRMGGGGGGAEKQFDPTCKSEVRRWTRGFYTLIHDEDAQNAEVALDLRQG